MKAQLVTNSVAWLACGLAAVWAGQPQGEVKLTRSTRALRTLKTVAGVLRLERREGRIIAARIEAPAEEVYELLEPVDSNRGVDALDRFSWVNC
ncbi:MAG: hypothetical protein GXP27_15720 [Planctomycetes bacterium]|nr:hypothetical protein [Planctomycetota bacterium]